MAAAWTAYQGSSRDRQAVQAQTEADPVTATDGVSLAGVHSVQTVLHAPGGQTFDGTGTLQAWIYTGTMWVHADWADQVLARAAGKADCPYPAMLIDSPRGQFQFVPKGVGMSGAGGNITSEYLCVVRPRNLIGAPA